MYLLIHPKLPMRSKAATRQFYIDKLGFEELGGTHEYLLVRKDLIEIHFFLFATLLPEDNYGQVYIRTNDVDGLYHSFKENGIAIHPNGDLQIKHWMQKEFSILDPDNNLLTFGQAISG